MKRTFTFLVFLMMTLMAFGQTREEILAKFAVPETVSEHIQSNRPAVQRHHRKEVFRMMPATVHHGSLKAQVITLDSIISVYTDETSKQTFLYDAQNRIVALIYSSLEAGVWVDNMKQESTYNAAGLVATQIIHYGEDGILLPFFRDVFTYDGSGNNTLIESFMWDEDAGAWSPVSKEELTYNSQGNVLTSIYTLTMAGMSMPSTKEEYTYDNQGNLTSHTTSNWNYVDAWIPYSKVEYTYNAAGLETLYIRFAWEDAWVNSSKEETTYNNNDDITLLISYIWEEEQWVNEYRDEYEYSGRLLTRSINKEWDGENWINETKDEYNYDSHDNMTLVFSYDWIENEWVPYDKTEISYNTSVSPGSLVWGSTWMGALGGMITGYKIYDWVEGEWTFYMEATFYWSGMSPTSAEAPQGKPLTAIYPNPAKDRIFIQAGNTNELIQVSLYDITGRKAMGVKVENNSTLMLDHLNKGIYIIVINDGQNRATTQKLVVH